MNSGTRIFTICRALVFLFSVSAILAFSPSEAQSFDGSNQCYFNNIPYAIGDQIQGNCPNGKVITCISGPLGAYWSVTCTDPSTSTQQ